MAKYVKNQDNYRRIQFDKETIEQAYAERRQGRKEVFNMGLTTDVLNEIKHRLIQAAHPKMIILFGSYAKGDFNSDSDIDLIVVEKSVKSRTKEMVRLRRVLRGILMPIDLIVVSEQEFQERSQIPNTLYYWAKQEGKVLHEQKAA